MYYICKYGSPLGGVTLASDGENLTGLWFDGQKYFADNLPKQHEITCLSNTKNATCRFLHKQSDGWIFTFREENPISPRRFP